MRKYTYSNGTLELPRPLQTCTANLYFPSLQVKKTDGTYIQAPYIYGAVLVNIGALMQQWTTDKYLATVSTVLNPTY